MKNTKGNLKDRRFKTTLDPLGLLDDSLTITEQDERVKSGMLKVHDDALQNSIKLALDKIPGVTGTSWLIYQITRQFRKYHKFPTVEQIKLWSEKDPTK